MKTILNLLLLVVAILPLGCAWRVSCENFVKTEVSSPKYLATVVTRACGPPSRDASYLNIRPAGTEVDFEKIRADETFLNLKSEVFQMEWRENVLVVDCSNCLELAVDQANAKLSKNDETLKIRYAPIAK